MIQLESVSIRRGSTRVSPTTLAFGPGVHALIGGERDGPPLILRLIAGQARAKGGKLSVLGGNPRKGNVRRQIAYIPLTVTLPELRVREVLSVAARIRKDPPQDPVDRLKSLGVGALADRRVTSLSSGEVRSVALAEALTSPSVRILLLEEPFLELDPRTIAPLGSCLRQRGEEGACIVVSTRSINDAASISEQLALFQSGVFLRWMTADQMRATGTQGRRLRVLLAQPRPLVAALATEPAVQGLEAYDGSVVVQGDNPLELAAAIARAITSTNVRIDLLAPDDAPPHVQLFGRKARTETING